MPMRAFHMICRSMSDNKGLAFWACMGTERDGMSSWGTCVFLLAFLRGNIDDTILVGIDMYVYTSLICDCRRRIFGFAKSLMKSRVLALRLRSGSVDVIREVQPSEGGLPAKSVCPWHEMEKRESTAPTAPIVYTS